MFKSVLDQERASVVLCDLEHTIVYMGSNRHANDLLAAVLAALKSDKDVVTKDTKILLLTENGTIAENKTILEAYEQSVSKYYAEAKKVLPKDVVLLPPNVAPNCRSSYPT